MNRNRLNTFQIKCINCGNTVTLVLPKGMKHPKLCKDCMQNKHYKQTGIRMK